MKLPSSAGSDHCRVTIPDDRCDSAAWFEFYRHLFPYDEAIKRLAHSSHLLEVGCGAGYGTHHVSLSIPDITGTDMSEQALAYARSHYPSVRFIQASGDRLPFSSQSFDAVISFQVIEHISSAGLYLRELARLLRPGGYLFLTTPNRRLRLLPWQKPWNPYHVHEYYDYELKKLVHMVFPDVQVLGIMATPELMRLERARVSQRVFTLPIKLLYRLVKPLIPPRLANMVSCQRACGLTSNGASEDMADNGLRYFSTSSDTRQCLDLFVVARKPAVDIHDQQEVAS